MNLSARDPSPRRMRPALRLVDTKTLDRTEWLAVRQQGIGSSDAAAAVGLHPYKSPLMLWLEKTGQAGAFLKNDVEDDTAATYWGTLLEPIVAAHYTKRTGHRVRRVNAVLQHPDPTCSWMLANIDREVIGAKEVQILECKTAGLQGARLWKDGVPEYVQLQVMHQLAVTGKQAADVAVLIGGQQLEIHRIERDEGMICNLIELERAFWKKVEQGVPPAADGSESSDQALRCLYPSDTGHTVDFRDDVTLSKAFADLTHTRQVLNDFGKLEARLKQQIQQAMGEASRAQFETGEVTWKRSKEGTSLDVARLLTEQPELLVRYPLTKPGSRRFLVV